MKKSNIPKFKLKTFAAVYKGREAELKELITKCVFAAAKDVGDDVVIAALCQPSTHSKMRP